MNELSLFTGAGGGLLGSKLLGHRHVGYVERDAYCQAVIEARIRDGLLDRAPIFGDIKAFLRDGWADRYRGVADLVSGGFPCPSFSHAARGRNVAENLWEETAECLRQVRPRFAFLENVTGLLGKHCANTGLARVLGDLAEIGFDAEWGVLSAGAIGAPHKRPRVWILARHPDRDGESGLPFDAKVAGVQKLEWPDRPGILRMGNGVAGRMERLGALGNGQVPAVVVSAWRELLMRVKAAA